MTKYSSSFSAVGNSSVLSIGDNEAIDITLTCSDWTDTVVKLQRALGGGAWENVESYSANTTKTIESPGRGNYRLSCTAYDDDAITYVLEDHNDTIKEYVTQDGIRAFAVSEEGILLDGDTDIATDIGAINSVSGLSGKVRRVGNFVEFDFTLDSVAMTHTDAAGTGSFASVKLFDFIAAGFQSIASIQDLSFLGDDLIDGDQGDMALVHGLGSVTADAGDGALTSTEVDIAAVSGTVTLSSYAATSTVVKGAGAAVVDGTSSAKDIWLNTSGTAATSEANGVLTVSGTIKVYGVLLSA